MLRSAVRRNIIKNIAAISQFIEWNARAVTEDVATVMVTGIVNTAMVSMVMVTAPQWVVTVVSEVPLWVEANGNSEKRLSGRFFRFFFAILPLMRRTLKISRS